MDEGGRTRWNAPYLSLSPLGEKFHAPFAAETGVPTTQLELDDRAGESTDTI